MTNHISGKFETTKRRTVTFDYDNFRWIQTMRAELLRQNKERDFGYTLNQIVSFAKEKGFEVSMIK